jgi:hypothetical protein
LDGGNHQFIVANKDFLNIHFKVVDVHYGGCVGIVLYDENIALNDYIEGEPNTLFITFFDGKIILNTEEEEDGYKEVEFG